MKRMCIAQNSKHTCKLPIDVWQTTRKPSASFELRRIVKGLFIYLQGYIIKKELVIEDRRLLCILFLRILRCVYKESVSAFKSATS